MLFPGSYAADSAGFDFFILMIIITVAAVRTIVVNILPSIPKLPPVSQSCLLAAAVRRKDDALPVPLTLIPNTFPWVKFQIE